MQDGIISGNGNSRYLKTVSAALGLYPTYEDFMAALIAGTFPIDLNGINTAGWTQQGTALNKANLFSDTTASALGLTASNTPNDALVKLKNLIDSANTNANSRAKITIGSYSGTNKSPFTLSFPISPKFVYIFQTNSYTGLAPITGIFGANAVLGTLLMYDLMVSKLNADWKNNSLTITDPDYSLNMTNASYSYIVIG